MSIEEQINNLLQEKLRNIEMAAQQRDTAKIISITADVETLEKLKRQAEDIKQALCTLGRTTSTKNLDSVNITHSPPSIIVADRNVSNNELNPKRIGEKHRLSFVKDACEHGVFLKLVKGRLFQNCNDALVGIAYASEITTNKWWLGLPSKNFHSIVLICNNKRNQKTTFIFPPTFYTKYKDCFSRDKEHNQLKFNISYRDGIYTLLIPDMEGIRINEYIDTFENLY